MYDLSIFSFGHKQMAWHRCASALHTSSLRDGTGFPFATLGGKVVLVLL